MTTIQITKSTLDKMKLAKEYSRQTYNELLEKAITIFMQAKQNNQYDEFLHKIQQQKMKEVWDNEQDEVWENV